MENKIKISLFLIFFLVVSHIWAQTSIKKADFNTELKLMEAELVLSSDSALDIKNTFLGGSKDNSILFGSISSLNINFYIQLHPKESFTKEIAFRKKQIFTLGKQCVDSSNSILVTDSYNKTILNLDSLVVMMYSNSAPLYFPGRRCACAFGLCEQVFLYKSGIGYITITYSIKPTRDLKNITFKQAADLLDKAIHSTWGIIRFRK